MICHPGVLDFLFPWICFFWACFFLCIGQLDNEVQCGELIKVEHFVNCNAQTDFMIIIRKLLRYFRR